MRSMFVLAIIHGTGQITFFESSVGYVEGESLALQGNTCSSKDVSRLTPIYYSYILRKRGLVV
jgi:hypothetical protein